MSKIRGKISADCDGAAPLGFSLLQALLLLPAEAFGSRSSCPCTALTACLGFCRMLMAELQMKLQWGHTWCSLQSSPQPFPVLFGALGVVLGVLLGAPRWWDPGKGLWVLSQTSPGLSFPAAKRTPESCTCTLGGQSPPEPPTVWGSPQVLLPQVLPWG